MTRRVTVTAVTVALALAGTAAAVGPAAATGGHGAFAAQARSAGLSPAQARTLQAQVDAEIAAEGGVQTAANQVTLASGTEVLLPLPGESTARDLGAPAPRTATSLAAPSSCGSYTFCAYSGENFTGTVKRQKLCSEPMSIPWVGNGSWSNNQSSGTRARMYNGSTLIYTTPGAYSEDRSGSWTSVSKVDAC
ncbi:hypothetical protein [Kitasatospora sp. NPDC088134]|uniref:hypothetical protein n=1 Tax=Kitasatospora sp. NPDC088134 TaxID=3364071 RepID=UPI003812A6DC